MSFCSDGVNPLKTMHLVYSMWPLMVSILNFPVALRKSVGGILLVGVIPGNGRKEAYHMDPYLDILVDELLVLAHCNIYYPAHMSAPIEIKVRLLQYVLDFPGISKVLKQPSTGAIMACPWCDVKGIHSHNLKKTVYRQDDKETQTLSVDAESKLRKKYDELPNENQKKKFS